MKIVKRLLLGTLIVSPYVIAQEPLSDLDLELDSLMAMDVQVTSAMKRAQSAFDTASSIYVLTKEQIAKRCEEMGKLISKDFREDILLSPASLESRRNRLPLTETISTVWGNLFKKFSSKTLISLYSKWTLDEISGFSAAETLWKLCGNLRLL